MNFVSPMILASIEASFWEDVNFQLVGFMIVMITLAGLWISLELIGMFFKSAASRQAQAAVPAPASVEEETDPELYAVVAAAIDTVVSQPHQIVSISSHNSPGGGQSAWSAEGRKDIYRSHSIR
jgi:Na+-transporting methylmalonyl-CoA/oxaloacetate decarboxylase gamma subunit